jgi:hypothetical protein
VCVGAWVRGCVGALSRTLTLPRRLLCGCSGAAELPTSGRHTRGLSEQEEDTVERLCATNAETRGKFYRFIVPPLLFDKTYLHGMR